LQLKESLPIQSGSVKFESLTQNNFDYSKFSFALAISPIIKLIKLKKTLLCLEYDVFEKNKNGKKCPRNYLFNFILKLLDY